MSKASRGQRTDAADNAARIIVAARAALEADNTPVRLDDIAASAGVGIATLYRHFPNREALMAAIFQHVIDVEIAPALKLAEQRPDAADGFVLVIEHVLSLLAEHRGLIEASRNFASFADPAAQGLFTALGVLLERAQDQGNIRSDLTPSDIPVLLVMLVGALQFTDSPEDWRRYLAVLMDAIEPAARRAELPHAEHANVQQAKLPPPLRR
ncbi:TetR/AcrR family transcriptional regulator [Nocardia salmonicida]|uniref:TetR/AcrR family transcriptional regulator n=1 Tax=Nocardia salmonicida TaxID=53431 RepID=UPI003670CA3A